MPRARLSDEERRTRAILSNRRYRAENQQEYRTRERVRDRRFRHGLTIHEWIAATVIAQDGKCYLCGDPLGQRLIVDHDHLCCPQGFSCPACRRGVACDRCNRLIGQVDDDPALLRRIADALESVLGPTRARIAAKPAQTDLLATEES